MKKFIYILLLCSLPLSSYATCGSVDYSWGASALVDAGQYVLVMMSYVVDLLAAAAAVISIISSTQIYIKMTTGQGEITKNILFLVGGILFIIGALFVVPYFFGIQWI